MITPYYQEKGIKLYLEETNGTKKEERKLFGNPAGGIGMKITIIGSTAYKDIMIEHQKQLIANGHECKIPIFDSIQEWNELEICDYNRGAIEWATEIHLIWDGRSIGTIFDIGMTFALRKPLKIIYINPKTFLNFVNLYGTKKDV